MIPLTFLYDEYIDRPKLSEQKKPVWVYSSSPTSGVGTKHFYEENLSNFSPIHDVLLFIDHHIRYKYELVGWKMKIFFLSLLWPQIYKLFIG